MSTVDSPTDKKTKIHTRRPIFGVPLPKNNYNEAFFGLYTNVFLLHKERDGETVALEIFRLLMERGLSSAYGVVHDKGKVETFVSGVSPRDENVGVKVEFYRLSDTEFLYNFITDPFPLLKGHVEHGKLFATFIPFKIKYFLGDGWKYEILESGWESDKTSIRIFRG